MICDQTTGGDYGAAAADAFFEKSFYWIGCEQEKNVFCLFSEKLEERRALWLQVLRGHIKAGLITRILERKKGDETLNAVF